MLRIVDSLPPQAVSPTRDPPIPSTLRFAIFHSQQPPVIIEERDGPQAPILIADIIIPYPPFLTPLCVALDVRGHVIAGAERDVEFLGRVVPCDADNFWCMDHWWRSADYL